MGSNLILKFRPGSSDRGLGRGKEGTFCGFGAVGKINRLFFYQLIGKVEPLIKKNCEYLESRFLWE
jgi:hypothetical protein